MKKNKLSPEVQKKLDEYTNKLLEEQLKMEKLISHDMDFNFLKELIDRVENKDIVIDIKLKDGTTLHIRKEKKENIPTSSIGRTK